MKPIGLLALQGGYLAHERHLKALGLSTRQIRCIADLEGLGGLVLPGGESTTQLNLIERFGLWSGLDQLVRSGVPVLGTCAGLILSSRVVTEPSQPSFGWLGVSVSRNGWGRQVHSFEAEISASDVLPNGGAPLSLTFIRAPRIVSVSEDDEVLLEYKSEPILVRRRNVYGATFHPELTPDLRLHQMIFGP